jgi:hypothetical protein
MIDQLLDLHSNLTSVQAKLLEILQEQLADAKVRERQQQLTQKHWTEFTISLTDSLDLISANASDLMRDLFTGLLTLQSFARDSAINIAEELRTLEVDVRGVRGELRQVQHDIDALGNVGLSKIDQIAEMSQHQLSIVPTSVLAINADPNRSWLNLY